MFLLVLLAIIVKPGWANCDFATAGPPYFVGRENGVEENFECTMYYVEGTTEGAVASGTCC